MCREDAIQLCVGHVGHGSGIKGEALLVCYESGLRKEKLWCAVSALCIAAYQCEFAAGLPGHGGATQSSMVHEVESLLLATLRHEP